MFTTKFAQVRNSMHTLSRAPLASGQKWVDQATSPAGHNVYYDRVRAASLPLIPDAYVLSADFLSFEGGVPTIKGDASKILKYIYQAPIAEIEGSNGESYCVIDIENVPSGAAITGFVDPADAPKSQYELSEGYDVHLFDSRGVEISRNCGWSFDFYNSILHFTPEMNPRSTDWPYGDVTLNGIVYIGPYVSTLVDNLSGDLQEDVHRIEIKVNESIEIQPFIFSTDNMTPIGQPYEVRGQSVGYRDFFQLLSVVIPAYVFEISMLDNDVTIITDMRHLPDGSTQIFINVPWDVEHMMPIVKYEMDPDSFTRQSFCGKYKFSASGFRNKDKSIIKVNKPINYDEPDAPGGAMIPTHPSNYEYVSPMPPAYPGRPQTRPMPAPPPFMPPPYGYYSDDDVYVNVHNN